MNRVGRCLSGLVGFLLLLGTAEAQSGEEMVPLYQEGGAFTPCQDDAGFSSLEPSLQVRLVQFVPADRPEAPRPEGCRLGYSYDGVDWFFLDLPITSIRYLLTPNRKHLLVVGEQAAPYPGTTLHHFNLVKAKPKLHTMHPFHHDLKQYDLNFYTVLPLPGEDEARYFLPSSKPSLEIPEDPKHPYDDPENDEEKIPYGDYDIELRVSRWSRFPWNVDDHFSLFFRLGKEILFNPDPKLYEPLFQKRIKQVGNAPVNDYPYYLYSLLSGHFSLIEVIKMILEAPTREVAPELEVNCDTPGEQFSTRIDDKLAFIKLLRSLEKSWRGLLEGNDMEGIWVPPYHSNRSLGQQEIPKRQADGTLKLCSEGEPPFTIPNTSIQFAMYRFTYPDQDDNDSYHCLLGCSIDQKKLWYIPELIDPSAYYHITPDNRYILIEESARIFAYRLSLFSTDCGENAFIDSISNISEEIISLNNFWSNLKNDIFPLTRRNHFEYGDMNGEEVENYRFYLYMNRLYSFQDKGDVTGIHMTIGKDGIHFNTNQKIYEDDFFEEKSACRIGEDINSHYLHGYLSRHLSMTEVARTLLVAPFTENNDTDKYSKNKGEQNESKPLNSEADDDINDKIDFLILLNSMPYLDKALHNRNKDYFLKSHPEENDHGTSR